jgi:acyl-coenzyme A synthetase/AMP-(fatty) acid ligase
MISPKNLEDRFHTVLKLNKIFYRYNDEKYSYRDLSEYFKKFISVTGYLNKMKQNRIAVICEKSFELYATSLSIIYSNNIWIPISTNIPRDRLLKILNEAQIDYLILKDNNSILNKSLIKLLFNSQFKILFIDEIKKAKRSVIKRMHFKKKDLSMIYFTSGSTGTPKMVGITFENFLSCLAGQDKLIYKTEKKLVFLDIHDISFVISLVILIPCVYYQGTIVPAKTVGEILLPFELIKKNEVNCFITVPSTISRLFVAKKKIAMDLKILICCGEPFYSKILENIIKNKITKKLFNCYGSTEVSPWVFAYKFLKNDYPKIKKYGLVPIGKPLNHVKHLIIENELYVSGPMVVKKYLNDISKNQFKKIKGKFFYKTNDLCKIDSGEYFIAGRNDSVIKIQGYRIELLEIDATLRKLENITNSFTFVNKDQKKPNYSNSIISVVESKYQNSEEEIIKLIKNFLPIYMIPKKIFFEENFPINKNGKIDRVYLKNKYQL